MIALVNHIHFNRFAQRSSKTSPIVGRAKQAGNDDYWCLAVLFAGVMLMIKLHSGIVATETKNRLS